MDATVRQQQIAERLRRDSPQQHYALAADFAVSMRTIRRDIHTLVTAGAPIVFEPGQGYVWRSTMDNLKYQVTGRVTERKQGGVQGLRVSVYDEDHVHLGDPQTGKDGAFAMVIDSAEYGELVEDFFNKEAPVYAYVYAGDEPVWIGFPSGVWNREARTFDFSIEVPSGTRNRLQRPPQSTPPSPPAPAPDGFGINESIRDALNDIAAYMPTATTTMPSSFSRGTAYGLNDPDDTLDSPINRAFATVLGSDLDVTKPNDVVQRLNRVFTEVQVDGNTELVWQSQPVFTVQTARGVTLSGAHASFYRLVASMLETAGELFSRVTPLPPKIADHETEAELAIVRSLLISVGSELQAEIPREQRVEGLFRSLDTQLDRVQAVFGLEYRNVITVDDEEIFASYRVGRRTVDELKRTFHALRAEMGGSAQFLGTQRVLLIDALSSLADTTDMTVNAMAAIGYGPLEQRAMLIPLPDATKGEQPTISFDGLMDWVRTFAVESRALIDEGGKRGVQAMVPNARDLMTLVHAAATKREANPGFRHPRVRRLLESLTKQLTDIVSLAEGFAH